MSRTLKITLFAFIIIAFLLLIPSFCNATEILADPAKDDLISIVANAPDGSTINLKGDFELSNIITVSGKTITINGNGHKISGNIDAINGNVSGDNKSLITAVDSGATVILKNLELTQSPKYGVQAYNGGKVTLNGVNIHDCLFGGVLNNCGTVEIIDLTLGHNGNAGSNNGIEMSKGLSLADQQLEPTLILNGTLESDQTEYVVYIAEDSKDTITSFKVENGSNAVDKIYVSGNKVVVTDSNNTVKFESNSSDRVTSENTSGETYVPNVKITLDIMKMDPVTFEVKPGTLLTNDDLAKKVDLTGTNYQIDGFYTANDYKASFDFSKPVNADTTIYVKLTLAGPEVENPTKPTTPSDEEQTVPSDEKPAEEVAEGEKDETPKTGVATYIGIASLVIVVSIATIVVLRKKNS